MTSVTAEYAEGTNPVRAMNTLLAASASALTCAAVLAAWNKIKSDRSRQATEQRLFELHLSRMVSR